MFRRSLTLSLLLLALAWPAGLYAQHDPFLGIWEMNLAKSKTTRGAPPKIESVINITEPGGFRSMLAVVNEKSVTVEIHHYNFDGAFHQTEGGDPRELSFKKVSANKIEQDTRRGTNITVHRTIEISAAGKTMTVIASGTSGSGVKYENDTRVYDKK